MNSKKDKKDKKAEKKESKSEKKGAEQHLDLTKLKDKKDKKAEKKDSKKTPRDGKTPRDSKSPREKAVSPRDLGSGRNTSPRIRTTLSPRPTFEVPQEMDAWVIENSHEKLPAVESIKKGDHAEVEEDVKGKGKEKVDRVIPTVTVETKKEDKKHEKKEEKKEKKDAKKDEVAAVKEEVVDAGEDKKKKEKEKVEVEKVEAENGRDEKKSKKKKKAKADE